MAYSGPAFGTDGVVWKGVTQDPTIGTVGRGLGCGTGSLFIDVKLLGIILKFFMTRSSSVNRATVWYLMASVVLPAKRAFLGIGLSVSQAIHIARALACDSLC